MAAPRVAARELHVVVPHFKRRLSGVTTTVIQLVPLQRRMLAERRLGLATIGSGLPKHFPRPRLPWPLALFQRPKGVRRRVWHARRNIEMLPAILARDVLRLPLAILFTSASQRKHTAYTRWLIGRMDRVVATSERGRAYLRVPAEVVMHGIDTDRFAPPPDANTLARERRELGLLPGRRYVGCFGRIRERKGTGDFVEAMLRVLPDRPDWIAIIAGRATAAHRDYEQSLQQRVKDAGLAERVLFVGEHAAIHRWHAVLDLYVAPQRWEGFGMTPLEAMASGVPVVATDVGAFPELILRDAGAVFPACDVTAMTEAIAAFMDDDVLRETASRAVRLHVEANFALEREAQRLCEIYVEMMDRVSD